MFIGGSTMMTLEKSIKNEASQNSARSQALSMTSLNTPDQAEITSEIALSICKHDHTGLLVLQEELLRAVDTYEQALGKLIIKLESNLKQSPEGYLRINQKGNSCDYYYYKTTKQRPGQYLSFRANQKLIHDICQKSYEQKLLPSVKTALHSLQKLSSHLRVFDADSAYDKLAAARKPLVSSYFLSDHDYVFYWKIAHQAVHSFREADAVYLTDNNERVRSKSEVIIANLFASLGVPYCYEPIVTIGRVDYRPDFIVLNVRTRKEYYWEHLGMLDDSNYVDHSFRKIAIYEKNGLIPGENLILSFESASAPLDILLLKQLIQKFCL